MDPFSEDLNVLKETAKTVEEIEKQLNTNNMGEGQVSSGEAQMQMPESTIISI